MARERSLLDRMREPDSGGSRTIHENTDRLAKSVMENLSRLLNSRHGVAMTRDAYGIPDLSEVVHNFPEAIETMRRSIKTSIETFEPRLKRVNVKHVQSPDDIFALHFEITADLVTEEEKASIWIETRVDGSGEVLVKG